MIAAIRHGAPGREEYQGQPADLAQKMRQINYVYRAMKGYINAGHQGATVPWTRQHPEAWETVTSVMKMRKRERDG